LIDKFTVPNESKSAFFEAVRGFVGNFVFSLADHAQNGFFFPVEWVPVGASAVAIGFLCVPVLMRVSRTFINVSAVVLILEAGVGLWGFALHTMDNLRGPSVNAFNNFIYGAPPMAPLLFPNLMVLGMLGLWQLRHSDGSEGLVAAAQSI
jgi:hypothetical protein